MKHRLRRTLAGLALATAAAAGTALTTDTSLTPEADTTWGAPAAGTISDSPPAGCTDDDSATDAPLKDTTWG